MSQADDFDIVDDFEVGVRVVATPSTGSSSSVPDELTSPSGLVRVPARHCRVLRESHEDVTISIGSASGLQFLADWLKAPTTAARMDVEKRWDEQPTLLLSTLMVSLDLEADILWKVACKRFGDRVRNLRIVETKWRGSSAPMDIKEIGDMLRSEFRVKPDKHRRVDLGTSQIGAAPSAEEAAEDNALMFYFSGLEGNMSVSQTKAELMRKFNDRDMVERFDATTRREKPAWQADDDPTATTCPGCHETFTTMSGYVMSMMTRKTTVDSSHCRVCGRRYCVNCTRYQVPAKIAEVEHPDGRDMGPRRKACKACFGKTHDRLHEIFLSQIFFFSGLNVLELNCMRLVNRTWRVSAEMCLYDYRQMLLVPAATLTRTRDNPARHCFAASAALYAGHPQMLVVLFYSLKWNDETQCAAAVDALRRTVTSRYSPDYFHWHLLCSRSCGSAIREFAGIHILTSLHQVQQVHKLPEPIQQLHAEARQLAVGMLCTNKPDVGQTLVLLVLDLLALQTHGRNGLCEHRGKEAHLLDLPCHADVRKVLLHLASLDANIALQIFRETMESYRKDGDLQLNRELNEKDREERCVSNTKLLIYLELAEMCTKHVAPEYTLLRSSTSPSYEPFERMVRLVTALERVTSVSVDADRARQEVVLAIRFYLLNDERDTDLVPGGRDVPDVLPLRIMPFLFDPSICIFGIKINGVKISESQQRPLFVPLLGRRLEAGETRDSIDVAEELRNGSYSEYPVLFKREDLQKDHVVTTMVRLIQVILSSTDKKAVRNVPTYSVMPLRDGLGVIEIVRDSVTWESLHAVQKSSENMEAAERKQSPVLTYISTLITKDSHDATKRFLFSAKFYLVVTYLLAIGDRHRDNVMMRSDGSMFHIDFGMIMNEKATGEGFTSSYVRFDDDLRKCVEYFHFLDKKDGDARLEDFLKQTATLFITLRPYADTISMLLEHLGSGMGNFVFTQFFVGKDDEVATREFVALVKRSMGKQWIKDILHTQGMTWKPLVGEVGSYLFGGGLTNSFRINQ